MATSTWKMGIMVTGNGVHTATTTENENDCFNLPIMSYNPGMTYFFIMQNYHPFLEPLFPSL